MLPALPRAARALLLAVLLASPVAAWAESACPEHFRVGREPVLVNPKLAELARSLCFQAFAVLHSGRSRTPLYAAEHLTRARVFSAREVDRLSSFHEEARLPPSERAELADYVRSGFDRGHMAPSGDMPDLVAQAESFTLANIVPQDPTDNRNLWAGVETAVRALAVDEGEAYVVTGPIYQGSDLPALRGRVLVPSGLFKAVYLPGRDAAGAYVTKNQAPREWRVVSLAALRDLTGLEVFPGLSEAARTTPARLPEPRDLGRDREGVREPRVGRRGAPDEGWLAAELRHALRVLWRSFLRALF